MKETRKTESLENKAPSRALFWAIKMLPLQDNNMFWKLRDLHNLSIGRKHLMNLNGEASSSLFM